MVTKHDTLPAQEILRLRLSQMLVNERYKANGFKIPIHLAFGHEAIAVAAIQSKAEDDLLVLSHRNIHYNLARTGRLKPILDEYLLREEGLAQGTLGSMNLTNPTQGIIYSSSILGNNLGVAVGVALANKVKGVPGVVMVVTGDGAMEEGSFYESLALLKSNDLSCLVIVENNGWSLATEVHQRRCDINLAKFADSFDIKHDVLTGNCVYQYIEKIAGLRAYAEEHKAPVCIDVHMSTLGGWWIYDAITPDGRYANYHAGPAPEVKFNPWPVLANSDEDPVFVLQNHIDTAELQQMAATLAKTLEGAVA